MQWKEQKIQREHLLQRSRETEKANQNISHALVVVVVVTVQTILLYRVYKSNFDLLAVTFHRYKEQQQAVSVDVQKQ